MSQLEILSIIDKESVEKAIARIDEEGYPPIRKSSMYDLVENNIAYPPKYIISVAGYLKNGKFIKHNLFQGGEKSVAFQKLRDLGFTILPKEETTELQQAKTEPDIHLQYLEEPSKEPKFSWLESHRQLVEYLKTKQDDQKGLIALLKKAGATMFNDEGPKGTKVDLEEIDPFTFFCYIHKYGFEKRTEIYKVLNQEIGINVPVDDSGIPSANAQKVWLFPYKYARTNNEIERLWNIFFSALEDTITDKQFADVLDINSTGLTKLTEGLYTILPERYFPINSPARFYIKEYLGLNPKVKTYSGYIELLDQIRLRTDMTFYQLSYEAWRWTTERQSDAKYMLIEAYKKRIKKYKLKNERYKWELVNKFKGIPDLNAPDLISEVKQIDFSNLVYALAGTIFKHLVRDNPDEMKAILINFYDETKPLDSRIADYDSEVMKLYRAKGGKHSHHQDERTISVLLTYKYPEKYTFFKSSYYKKYCDLLNIQPAKKGEKYAHYLSLINELINEYLSKDQELINMVKLNIPDYDGSNHLILAQDVLYQMLDQDAEVNYWIFQGNQDIFNVRSALAENELHTWRVNAHKDKIKEGDKVILWVTGKESGCYALAEVSSEVYDGFDEIDELKYYVNPSENEESTRVNLDITHNLNANPITSRQIEGIKELENLKVGNQGTNFDATEKEYEMISQLAEENELKTKVFADAFDETDQELMTMNLPLNVILYGPPGTGKTYRLKDEFFSQFTDQQATKTKDEYLQELVTKYSWWEVAAAALLENNNATVSQIIEHELIKAKESVSSNKNIRAGIWGTLQSHTIESCEFVKYTNRQPPLVFNKTENSNWEVLPSLVEQEASEVLELVRKSKEYQPVLEDKKRYIFTTFHQSFSYEDFIEGIKPLVESNENNPELGKQVVYEVVPGLFKEIVAKAKTDPENRYAIFIDEINRGNIANIFGELITLIEEDKRIGDPNYIPAKLPYSGEMFGVPSNLFIIGTMNTADRSVEALDTALRRRFSFIEMNPEPSLLAQEEFKCTGIELDKLLTAMNSRIEKLLDKDYCIGHSYFMTINDKKDPLKELKTIFHNKILPLLQEYFYGDWGKIMLVLGNEFVTKKENNVSFMPVDSSEDYDEYSDRIIYSFVAPDKWDLASFTSIYE